jgi:hypothetical protein
MVKIFVVKDNNFIVIYIAYECVECAFSLNEKGQAYWQLHES